MDEESKSGAMPLPPAYDGAAKPHRRSRVSWVIRIVLLVALWLPQPFLLFREFMVGTAHYGFLGMWNYVFVGAALVMLSAFIIVARSRYRPTVALGCATAMLVALCAANAMHASSQFVDEATYDRQAARSFSDDTLSNNLEGGYEQYRPFTGQSVARLDEPSALTFSAGDGLPHVDSATALLPLASAFVTATYPKEATTVGWEGQEYMDYYSSGHFDGFIQCFGGGDGSQRPAPEQYENFKAGGGADGYPEAYREGYVSGWEDALAAQAQGVKRDTAEYYDNGKGAIGYSFRYYVTDLVGDYDVKLLAIGGAAPILENIEDGSYPITGEFYAVTRKGDLEGGRAQIEDDPSADTRQANLARLIDWIRGEQGQELVVKSGYARL